MRKPKRETQRNKGKLPFKCFDLGKIGHYAKRCPFKEPIKIKIMIIMMKRSMIHMMNNQI